MKITVRLFAGARQLAGRELAELQVPEGATLADVRRALQTAYPVLQPLLAHARLALNREYRDDRAEVPAGAEIACIPPVSGG